ncbi:hypothetical protein B0H10DRAFT_1693939, partial [Mycena sp. CBHHK59/15]
YQFTAEDYLQYQHRCRHLLSQPRSHAAFLKGGIVWRLACNILSSDTVFTGPSVAAVKHQFESSLISTDMWDDILIEEELNLICGMHRVPT